MRRLFAAFIFRWYQIFTLPKWRSPVYGTNDKRNAKNNKAVGNDEIPIEIVKLKNDDNLDILRKL